MSNTNKSSPLFVDELENSPLIEVKITKTWHENTWYANKIGNHFLVKDYSRQQYIVWPIKTGIFLIEKSDCVLDTMDKEGYSLRQFI